MVGPGTGVAPFMGFIDHRTTLQEELQEELSRVRSRCEGYWRALPVALRDEAEEAGGPKVGGMWLFFGCRHPEQDYLFRSELQRLAGAGAVRLTTAFSRAQTSKEYVQHKMRAEAAELLRWLVAEDAVLYLCGDGAHMAKDVRRTLEEILEAEGGKGAGQGKATVDEWVKQGKFLQDIWS